MLNNPKIYNADGFIKDHSQPVLKKSEAGEWVLARPLPFWGLCLRHRIKTAWMVFTGQADVLVWRE